MKTLNIEAWLKAGEYLPKPIRDFHVQKDLFKAIHDRIDLSKNDYCKSMTWVMGHVYVVDIFLWWMARHGYTLQRTRQKGNFQDLATDVDESKQQRAVVFQQAFLNQASPAEITLPTESKGEK